ncbi:hypothetical protein AX15_002665 [Amanita polypyramis BW_CC]|nr:hypothetical protein AX15_002665 [Amanita polypyramis BW_CC]
MKCISYAVALTALVAFVSSLPILVKREVDPELVPQFGIQPGANQTGTGDCDGITNSQGEVVKIPCSCPPDRSSFIQSLNANVAAGHAVNNPSVPVIFPTDDSKASQIARIQASLVTLQNLRGPGIGCPAASTTFLAQQKAIENNGLVTAREDGSSQIQSRAASVDPALVPDLGHEAGLNPDGTGNCDGIKNAQGQVIKVPCSCPPDRNGFIQALSENVAAGRAVNNPTIPVTFPADGSNASKVARIQASLVTLQNLRGPGVGCPAASTTLLQQLLAIQG